MGAEVRHLRGSEHFKLIELLNLGQRLTEEQLGRMGLYDGVRHAEYEYYWRSKAATEVLNVVGGGLVQKLKEMASGAERQLLTPRRGLAPEVGDTSRGGGSLASPGTLIVRKHVHKSWSSKRPQYPTYRFVVVEEQGVLLNLGEKDGPIYRNPSLAAQKATGNDSGSKWDFFQETEP